MTGSATTGADVLSAVRGVSVDLGGRRVLDGVDLEVRAGEQLTLVGRSGSGKTTLMLLLAGLLPPSAGQVDLRLDPREVMYVPQGPSLLPELSAQDNAALPLRLRGTPPAEALRRGREQLALLGLDDARRALPGELSGGMQQRVALARALATGPRLLLADEPTGALDTATAGRTMDVLRAAAERMGTAVVIATHDPAVAAGSTRLLRVDGGRTREAAA